MTYASEVLADNPLGYWKLDESSFNLADSSGNGLAITSGTGTYTLGSATSPPQGGTSVNYNGGDTGVVMSAPTARPLTLECWFYPTTNDGGAILNRGEDFGANGWALGIGSGTMDSNGLEVIGLVNAVAWKASGYTLPALNAWYHIVMTDDGTNIRFYVDGSLVGTVATSTPVSPSNEMHIGRQNTSGRAVVGNIAHVAVYDTALSGTRITAHYDARSASSTAKSDTDTFTLSESEALTTLTAKADTDTFTATDTTDLSYRTSLVATDLFRATELSFLNYTPTAPLNVKITGHRVYGQLADADNLPAIPSPSRTFRMPSSTIALDFYLLDENGEIIDPAGLTMTFDVGTPGVRVEGRSGDIFAEPSGAFDPWAWITIPGGLNPGVYSCRLTVNTGTTESPIYRSYPTEAITLIVEE